MQKGNQIFLLFRLGSTPFIGYQELCSALKIKNGAPAFKELYGNGVNRGVNTECFTLSLVKVGKDIKMSIQMKQQLILSQGSHGKVLRED